MTVGLGRLARSVEEMVVNMTALAGAETVHHRPYVPQTGDVFIASWAKSGTTMMQQMFHQLRMGAATGAGDMDFDDISRMTPWEDTATLVDLDMQLEQRAAPRGFKSHREYERLPAGMRYVVTLRDPHESYASFYRFQSGYTFEPGSIDMIDFFPLWAMGGPGGCDYFTHLISWYARRDEPDTLLATYRWAVKHKRETIGRLAALLDIELTDELAALVEEYTSRAFMVAHKDKFDDLMIKQAIERGLGTSGLVSDKVHAEASDASVIPPQIAAQIDAMWAERAAPATGHADFASLAAELETGKGA